MLIGIDIDDVLYNTSLMIRQELPPLLRKMNLPDAIDENQYNLVNKVRAPKDEIDKLNHKLNWISLAYICAPAVRALKTLKQTNSEVEYCIVTWRSEPNTLPILQFLRDYFYLDINRWHCLPCGTSKADFCENNDIAIMLDDYNEVIQDFRNHRSAYGVLVSTNHVLHNKQFAAEHDWVLYDWSQLHSLYGQICAEREKTEC